MPGSDTNRSPTSPLPCPLNGMTDRQAIQAGRVHTTWTAGKILGINPGTVARLMDAGQIKGYRIPGSKVRRIPREALRRYCEATGRPTDWDRSASVDATSNTRNTGNGNVTNRDTTEEE